jgi:hypothetical protein
MGAAIFSRGDRPPDKGPELRGLAQVPGMPGGRLPGCFGGGGAVPVLVGRDITTRR